MEIIFNQDEKDNFISAINFLIHEVEACIQRNVLTQHGKVSVKGTSQKDINIKLDFLKKYNYSYKIGLGNAGGFLNEDSWIIFVRNDLLASNLINGEKLTATKGIYIFIAFSGYFSDDKHIQLSFGFPQGDMNLSRCSAIDQMDRSGKLRYFDFKYKDLEKEANQIVKDFQDMINYFNIFDKNDFKLRAEFSTFIPLNQILYGPPGTGKTYHIIDKALEIFGENLESRDEKKAKFDEYARKGQIVFTTFHQSYGYEEFVEGIKPIIDNDENSQEVKYDVKDGIFKELCDKSLKNYILSMQNENEIDLDKLIFEFANYINQDFLNKGNEFPLENKVSIKKILLNSKDEYRSFLLGGSIKSPQRLTIDIIKRDYLNFKNKKILSFKDIKPKYDSQSDYHGNAIYYFMFYNKLKEFENIQNEKFKIKKEILKSYIIIIDEINRGNVSKIFGELITLIEPSKRIGEKEELKVKLPYSGEEFGVPKNVYIIGTMNTADRSITSLDTALRRRFEFIEMMPDVSKLSMDCEGINLQELLKAINTRIEYLLDREKTIGHAFFIGVENLNDLKKVFQNKIIPLLQEYFYNDYALIDAVLNKNDMLEISVENKDYLKNMTEFIESDKIVYKFSDSNNWSKDTFIKIYE
ncbi:AAA family ATPase [Campylobacter jejuni]|uniref:McrB family protein n=1 Tax=Campylobacter jejuni TaxID=197 RepID=UPI0012751C35|nr:AAA family ATPase [Campylobacter jejuni]EAH6133966.1 restriction endonuclease [Campylobacter jejuni]EAH7208887.1 restriction endonuclease [Campylobacter jejuni]EAI3630860.1 restriction endonuclease [Campylobacter jejuni]EAI8440059.1 restriction endonuclease [Campylobacter jejuni]EAL4432097.1 restriction endonuclease [Campylobacter jejuni]